MKKTALAVLSIILLSNASYSSTMRDCIDIALKNNPAVSSSKAKLDAASAKFSQAVGAFMPTIKLDGNMTKMYAQPGLTQITTQTTQGAVTQTFQFGTNDPGSQRTLTASLTQPIFVAALFPGYKIAQKGVDYANEDYRKTVINTSFAAVQGYFNVLKAQRVLTLNIESRDMAADHVAQVEKLLSAGSATRADLLRAEVQHANSELALTQAQNGLEVAKDGLNNALGLDLETKVDLQEPVSLETNVQVPDFSYLTKVALEKRPEWLQYILAKDMAQENVQVAQSALLPTVMFTGQQGNNAVDYPSYKYNTNSWNVSGVASWTLFQGFTVENKIREAIANLNAQKATEEQVKNFVLLEVRNAFFNLKTALLMVPTAKKALDSAEESYKVSDLRYMSGIGTNLEVVDAQVSLTQARISYWDALYNVKVAIANLDKAVGWEVL